jgi:bla regulator protein blaR1
MQLGYPDKRMRITGSAMAILGSFLFLGMMGQARSQDRKAAQPQSFEVASIKPSAPVSGNMMMVRIEMAPGGRFVASGVTLRMLLQQAYDVKDYQITGGPGWISTERYDINAKADVPDLKRDQVKILLQSLLAERFQLNFHRETKDLPIYNLVIGKSGHKLHKSEFQEQENPKPKEADAENVPRPGDEGAARPNQEKRGAMMRMGRGSLDVQMARITGLVNALGQLLGKPVIDQTGLQGNWDFKLEWTPDETQRGMGPGGGSPDGPPPGDASGPSIFTALQEQLGLRLESGKGPVETLAIDRVEKPSEN